jgi:tripartite-type tricarboxylate transporter receptor subunit TctC
MNIRVVLILLCGSVAVSTHAQTYPVKPVRLVSPYPPGSSADFTSRLYGAELHQALGQQFIVDNRPGAAGNIGAEVVARATPDGYTLLTAPAALATSASLYKNLRFDIVRDFEPISMLTTSAQVLAVRATLPVKSVKELIALAKSRPGQLTYASTGTGGTGHLTMELFRLQAEIDMVHVPYKGSSTAVPDVVGGQVDMMFSSSIALMPHMKAGRIRALGITSVQRSPAIPELPTVAEAGLPGFEAVGWSAMLAPAKTPRSIVMLLNSTILKIAQMPHIVDRLAAQGASPLTSTPEQTRSIIQREVVKWEKVIKTAGIKAE